MARGPRQKKNTTPSKQAHNEGLHQAAAEGDEWRVLYLASSGLVDINSVNSQGESALSLAVQNGHSHIVDILLEVGGADASLLDLRRDAEPLWLAARLGHTETVEAHLRGGADVNQREGSAGNTPIIAATIYGRLETALALVKAGANLQMTNKGGLFPLFLAADKGYTELALALVKAGADVNQADNDGDTALIMAADKGHGETALALVKAGADVNHASTDGDTALMHATYRGHPDVALGLVKAGAAVNMANGKGCTALIEASRIGHTEVALALVKAGADINQTNDRCSVTPLNLAAGRGHTETALALVEAGAESNRASGGGPGALVAAVLMEKFETATALVKAGVDLNSIQMVLCLAAHAGHTELVRALLNAGADVNNTNDDPPLVVAASRGHTDTVLALLKAGADWTLTAKTHPETALEAARRTYHHEALVLLIEWPERVIHARHAMLVLAWRAGRMGRAEEAKDELGDLSVLPGDVLRQIGMMVYVPAQAWREWLPDVDWRSAALELLSSKRALEADLRMARVRSEGVARDVIPSCGP